MTAATLAGDTLDGLRLNHALQAGILRLLSRQEHLNKINVFPVPDGDTGTNLALTMSAVLGALKRWPDAHAGKTLTRIADTALDGARGNSGAILAQFFLGVGDRVGHLGRLSIQDFAEGLRGGAAYARDAMTEPREGTILTVLADFAQAVAGAVRKDRPGELIGPLREGLDAAQESLERTRHGLEAMRKANVVDAGAQGFVELMVGVIEYIDSGAVEAPPASGAAVIDASDEPSAGVEEDLQYRYCTECLVTGTPVDRRRLREQLAALGGSLVIAGLANKVRVHVHVDDPAAVFLIAAGFGTVSAQKADDMQRQQHATHLAQHRVAIVTDSAADIPEEQMERLGIHMVPVRVHFGERSYLDKVGIGPEEFFAELRHNPAHPKTSQPPPGDFRRLYEFLGSHFDAVLSINISRRVSGTCNAAETAASRSSTHGRVTVIDSLNASTGQGLIVMYAAECVHAGHDLARTLAATRAIIPRTRTYAIVGALDYTVRGGRIPAWVKRVADVLQLMPVLHTRRDGRVAPGGVLFGRRDLRDKFARYVRRRMRATQRYRVLVGHADCEAAANTLLEALAGPNVEPAGVVPIGSALGVHGGPGMLVVGIQEYTEPK